MPVRSGIHSRGNLAALWFTKGTRPCFEAVEELGPCTGFAADRRSGEGLGAELLLAGLTFDLFGLANDPPVRPPSGIYKFGLPPDFAPSGHEALVLSVGPHLKGGAHLRPVVRSAAAVLMGLARLPGLGAISWLPAANLVSPDVFEERVGEWLAGGPFPAFALVSLVRQATGGVASCGLKYLTGREFRLETGKDAPGIPLRNLALGLLDWLVLTGDAPLPDQVHLPGAGHVRLRLSNDGETLFARPDSAVPRLTESAGPV